MKAALYSVILCFAAGAVALFFAFSVQAEQFQSPRYRIESGSFKLQQDLNQSSSNYDITSNFGSDLQKNFESKGYVAVSRENTDASGKPYVRLQLTNSQLVFDNAEVKDEAEQKSTVKIMGSNSKRFIIATRQESQFKNGFGATVESTRCDNVNSPCTPTLAQSWKKVFGFGFRVNGSTMKDFDSDQAYRPFFIGSPSGRSAVLFNGELDKNGKIMVLQFKLRPRPETQTGIYKSTIIITATSDY